MEKNVKTADFSILYIFLIEQRNKSMTRTAEASSHTFYGPDDVWQKFKVLCPLKLGKPASRRIEELIEADIRTLEGAPEPDQAVKAEEKLAALQERLLEIEVELDKTKRVIDKNKDYLHGFSMYFHMNGEYPLFQKETGDDRIVNGRKQLARFIRDNPLKGDPPELVQLGIRVVELRIERQEVTDKLRVLQCMKYGLPLPGSEEETKMLQEKEEQERQSREDEGEIKRRMEMLEEDADRRELAEAVAKAEYPTCPKCGEEAFEASSGGLPEVVCRNWHHWSLEYGLEEEEDDVPTLRQLSRRQPLRQPLGRQ
jgi:hypothetical protein